MERRALIAVVISLIILIVYQEVIIKHLYGPPSGPLPGEAPLAPLATPPFMPPPPPAAPAPEPPSVPAEPVAERAEGRDITVDIESPQVLITAELDPFADCRAVKLTGECQRSGVFRSDGKSFTVHLVDDRRIAHTLFTAQLNAERQLAGRGVEHHLQRRTSLRKGGSVVLES